MARKVLQCTWECLSEAVNEVKREASSHGKEATPSEIARELGVPTLAVMRRGRGEFSDSQGHSNELPIPIARLIGAGGATIGVEVTDGVKEVSGHEDAPGAVAMQPVTFSQFRNTQCAQ